MKMITFIILVIALVPWASGQTTCTFTIDPLSSCSVTCGTGIASGVYPIVVRPDPGQPTCIDELLSLNATGGSGLAAGFLVSAVDNFPDDTMSIVKTCQEEACTDPCDTSTVDGSCEGPCGTGSRTIYTIRKLPLIVIPGTVCENSTVTEPCDTGIPCPCEFSWNTWGSCSETCGPGTRTRTPNIISQPDAGGAACPDPENENCNYNPCPVDCVYNWEPWASCSVTCGTGSRTRTLTITTDPANDGTECPEDREETETCSYGPCPIDCVYNWESWGSCSVTCGGDGTRTRTLTITTQPENGGEDCPEDTEESETCNYGPCPTKNCYKCYDKECKINQEIPIGDVCPVHTFQRLTDCQADCEECTERNAVDLVFVVDSSGSVFGESDTLRSFLADVVRSLGTTDVRIGIISFYSKAQVELSFDTSSTLSRDQIIAFIMDQLRTPDGTTNIGSGLKLAIDMLNGPMNRADVPDVVITITDGENVLPGGATAAPNNPLVYAEQLRALGATTIGIGVGSVSEDTILELAGSPERQFTVDNFDQLESIVDDLAIMNPCKEAKLDKVIHGNYLYAHRYHGWFSPFKHSGSVFNFPRTIGAHGAGAGNHLLQREIDRTANSHLQREQFCSFPVATGHGHQQLSRYFYNPFLGICQHFIYTGEGGNPNNFISKNHCDNACGRLKREGIVPDAPFYNKYGGAHNLF